MTRGKRRYLLALVSDMVCYCGAIIAFRWMVPPHAECETCRERRAVREKWA